MDTDYPGYLIVGAKEPASRLSGLSVDALNSAGIILGAIEERVYERLSPKLVIINKHGFSKGFSCHFHIVPIYSWAYSAIKKHPGYKIDEPDGADFTMFITRQYCQKREPLPHKVCGSEKALSLLDLKGLNSVFNGQYA